MADWLCATRMLKQARFLQRTHPELVGAEEPSEGFPSVLEGSDPFLRFELRAALDPERLPPVRPLGALPGFSGVVRLAPLRVRGASGGRALELPPAALATLQDYLGRAGPWVARYASAHGPVSVRFEAPSEPVDLVAAHGRFNDSQLRAALEGLGARAPGDALLVVNPLGSVNLDAEAGRGSLGYHSNAGDRPYGFLNLRALPDGLADRGDAFAYPLSHVLAEVLTDPGAMWDVPEVADDPAAEEGRSARAYFATDGTFLAPGPDGVAGSGYAFFTAGIAPARRPPGEAGPWKLSPPG